MHDLAECEDFRSLLETVPWATTWLHAENADLGHVRFLENDAKGGAMDIEDTIWVVVNAEDTQEQANEVNARGCREVCDLRIQEQADMMYPELHNQAMQLCKDDRIVMHQGGARILGGQLLRAAGRVASVVRQLMPEDIDKYPRLWQVTARWYRKWSYNVSNLHGQLFIKYDLKEAKPPQPSPKVIRPRQGNKFIPLHKNCHRHVRCEAYSEVDAFWRRTMSSRETPN